MNRSHFLKIIGGLAAAPWLAHDAAAADTLKMLIPADAGGGWDTTGRALGKAMVEAKVANAVQYENKGGSAGALGLAHFINGAKADPNALMMMGSVMLGGLISSRSPLRLQTCTPIARLTAEYNVFAVEASSPLRDINDLVSLLKRDPASVKWGGGSKGSTEHIAASMLARAARVDPKKVNYVAHRGGGEALASLLKGEVTVGGSGYSEFAEAIRAKKLRPLGITSQKRIPGIDIPTLKEIGFDVVIGNWRGVYGAPGITAAQKAALTDVVTAATRSPLWQEALAKNGWTPAFTSGKDFEEFVEYEFSAVSAIMFLSGMF